MKEEARPITADVTSASFSGPITVKVQQGATPSLKVSGEPEALDRLLTTLEGSKLTVAPSDSINSKAPITVTLVLPSLVDITASNTANVEAQRISGAPLGQVTLTAATSGKISFEGQCDVLKVQQSGSSHVKASSTTAASQLVAVIKGGSQLDAGGFHSKMDDVNISQASQASVFASASIIGAANGASKLVVLGHPAERTVTADITSRASYD